MESNTVGGPLPPLIEGTSTIDYARWYREEKRRIRNAQKGRSPSFSCDERTFEEPSIVTPLCVKANAPLLLDSESFQQAPPLLPLIDSLKSFLKGKCLFYQQHFLPPSFHDTLYHWLLYDLPERPYSSSQAASSAWVTLPHAQRRVALFTKDAFPPLLQQLVQYLPKQPKNAPEINHILLNHYPMPEHGILPHTDGPAYAPFTITVSLGPGDVLLHFTADSTRDSTEKSTCSVALHGNGSCIRFQDDAYSKARHSICAAMEEEEWTTDDCVNAPAGQRIPRMAHRISITLRHYYTTPVAETSTAPSPPS